MPPNTRGHEPQSSLQAQTKRRQQATLTVRNLYPFPDANAI